MIIHQINGYIQTLYLVEYPDKLLLLDSGCREDVKRVKVFIEQKIQRKFSELELVLVSHAHPDHSGGASYFQEQGVKIASAADINTWYSGVTGFLTYWIDIALTYFVASKKKAKFENILFPRKIKPDITLEREKNIPGFEDWKILSTSGHTNSDLTFFHSVGSLAYIADNIVSSKKKYFRPYPVFEPEKYKKSLQRYIDLNVEHFLLAHYGKHKISKEHIQKLIDSTPKKARRHLTSLHSILISIVRRSRKN